MIPNFILFLVHDSARRTILGTIILPLEMGLDKTESCRISIHIVFLCSFQENLVPSSRFLFSDSRILSCHVPFLGGWSFLNSCYTGFYTQNCLKFISEIKHCLWRPRGYRPLITNVLIFEKEKLCMCIGLNAIHEVPVLRYHRRVYTNRQRVKNNCWGVARIDGCIDPSIRQTTRGWADLLR